MNKKIKTLSIEQANRIMKTNGESLDLSGTSIQSLPDNLTVGGSLDLSGTSIQSLPDNLTVGGSLDLRGTSIKRKKTNKLKNGDYVPARYIYADGILTHIKKRKKIGNFWFYVGKIKGENVVSDGTHYAHCNGIKEGIADIIFKTATERGSERYKNLTLESEIKTEDAIAMYRIITGACKQGTQNFVDGIEKLKESYTIKEIIEMTSGHYGAETFKNFFM